MTSREQFEQWCDETHRFEDEHYYQQGSQTRRHYPEDQWEAWEASRQAMPCEAPWPEYS